MSMNKLAQEEFVRSCDPYSRLAHTALSTLEMMESPLMDYKTAAAFTLRHRMFFNKGQLESSFEMFPVGGGLVNMKAFLDKIKSVDPAPGTIYSSISPSSPNKSHLALSGVSTSDTTNILKPFPKHWGVPPNASLKGADGAVRQLPAGFGSGNAAMHKWVKQHIDRDAFAQCDENGKQPFPYGNYSLGCSPTI